MTEKENNSFSGNSGYSSNFAQTNKTICNVNSNKAFPNGKNTTSVTHTEFMNFVDPFTGVMTEKRFNDFVGDTEKKELIGLDIYTRNAKMLRRRLCGSVVLTGEIEEIGCYEEELKMLDNVNNNNESNAFFPGNTNNTSPYDAEKEYQSYDNDTTRSTNQIQEEILSKDHSISFLYNHSVLDSFFLFSDTIKAYKQQIDINNSNKKLIRQAIAKRAILPAYFKLYDIISKELVGYFAKRNIKKKRKADEFDDLGLKEYLLRYEEFIQEFGKPEQFKDDEMSYPDILDSSNVCEQYLR